MTEKIEINRKPDLIKKRRKQGGKRPGSGRKKGTPNKLTFQLKESAAQYGDEALKALVALIRNNETPPATIVAACRELLDRGFGKPAMSVDISDSHKNDNDLMELVKAQFIPRMEEARRRHKQLLIDRGIIDIHAE